MLSALLLALRRVCHEGYKDAPEDATTGERVANALGGGIKEIDDGIVSGLAGAAAASATVAGGLAISSGGVTLPAGAACSSISTSRSHWRFHRGIK